MWDGMGWSPIVDVLTDGMPQNGGLAYGKPPFLVLSNQSGKEPLDPLPYCRSRLEWKKPSVSSHGHIGAHLLSFGEFNDHPSGHSYTGLLVLDRIASVVIAYDDLG